MRRNKPEIDQQRRILTGREAHQQEALANYQNAIRIRDGLVIIRDRVLMDIDHAEKTLETARKELRKEI